jgi:hypothetical protein
MMQSVRLKTAYGWNVLGHYQSLSATTSWNLHHIRLTGSGQKFQVLDALNVNSQCWNARTSDFVSNEQVSELSPSLSVAFHEYYSFDGVDGNG